MINYKTTTMKWEQDLEVLKTKSRLNLKENQVFFEAIEKQSNSVIDAKVKDLNDVISREIDCLDCGNCCQNLRPIATDEEMSKFVKAEDIETYKYAYGFTCKNINLCDFKCQVYLERPQECQDFPYMDRPHFSGRKHEILQNAEVCPIVYNVLESLKKEVASAKS